MAQDKLAADEARRLTQHERIKEKLEQDVHDDIARQAELQSPAERAQHGAVATDLKRKAAREVVETEAEVDRARRTARVSQVVDYVFFLIYSLIALEIGLELLGARESSGFKRFLDAVTAPILVPFRGLMPDPAVGSFQLMLSYVVAAVVYLILHQAVKRLLRMVAGRTSTVS
jgi:uncharacterized protein YggT (Ycf19 family)